MRTMILVAGALAAAAGGCRKAKLAAQGESETLQPEPPGAGGSPLVIVALDGVDRKLLYDMLRSGELPGMAALLYQESGGGLEDHAHFDDTVVSVLPSATIPNWGAVWTGVPPAEHGVPGNELWIREAHRYAAPAPVMVPDRTEIAAGIFTDDYANDLLAVPTVWERLRERAPNTRIWISLAQFHRGADRLLLYDLDFVIDTVEESVGRALGDGHRDVWEELDEEALDSVLDALDKGEMPDVLVSYLPGVDSYAHEAQRGPERARREYLVDVIDPRMAQLAQRLRGRNAWVMILSDHGHLAIQADDRHALDGEPIAVLESAGYSVRPFASGDGDDDADHDAVLAYQGFMAFVYLRDRSTRDWRDAPRLEEDLLPAARAFEGANRAPTPMRGTLDAILIRRDGQPLRVLDRGRQVALSTWLRNHPHPDWLDPEARLAQLADGPYADRAGDLILISRQGATPAERFYFSRKFHSEHGGLSRAEGEVPFILAHPGRTAPDIARLVRHSLGDHPRLDGVAKLILELRGGAGRI